MKIVNIIGGLGNQMFQYALARTLEKKFGEPIYVDTTMFDTYNVHNGLEIERVFDLKLNRADIRDIKRLTRYAHTYTIRRIYSRLLPVKKSVCREPLDGAFEQSIFTQNTDRYYDGYWQNSCYFKDAETEIRQTYRFALPLDAKNRELSEKIMASQHAVGVHVRRGDYLKSSIYAGICTIEYYKHAVEYIKQHIDSPLHFFIFSDDALWCKCNLEKIMGDSPCTFIDWNHGTDSYKDMQLMSLCRHNIIANSSFSWWAAWLNQHQNNLVIAPTRWLQTKNVNHIQMPQWVLIQ